MEQQNVNVNWENFEWEEVEPAETFKWIYCKGNETKDLRGWLCFNSL